MITQLCKELFLILFGIKKFINKNIADQLGNMFENKKLIFLFKRWILDYNIYEYVETPHLSNIRKQC